MLLFFRGKWPQIKIELSLNKLHDVWWLSRNRSVLDDTSVENFRIDIQESLWFGWIVTFTKQEGKIGQFQVHIQRRRNYVTRFIIRPLSNFPAVEQELVQREVWELRFPPKAKYCSFLAVQDAAFYSVGKIAKKNLATSSKNFSCYPSGHVFSYQ